MTTTMTTGMTTSHGFVSAFAPQLEAYLAFKQAMGCYGASRIWYLRRFDTYCARHGRSVFDRDTVEGWVLDQLDRSSRYRSWMSYIRDFGRWLQAHGHADAYVLSDRWKAPFVPAHPYLLSTEEIERFFTAAAHLQVASPWRWQAAAFFTLMHSCGIRTGEARALTHRPGRPAWPGIWTSSGPRATAAAACPSPTRSSTCWPSATGHHVASSPRGTRSSSPAPATQSPPQRSGSCSTGSGTMPGCPGPYSGQQPRPYDFRHHFAYANLERWMTHGADVTALLPYLSRYMGHAGFESTYYYVHTSPDFLRRLRRPHQCQRVAAAGGRVRMKRDPDTDAPDLFSFARDYLHGYLPKVRGLSPKTIQAYRISLECFLGYLAEAEHLDRAQVSFDHFDRTHLKAWLAWMSRAAPLRAQDGHAAPDRDQDVPGLQRLRGHHPDRAQPGREDPARLRPAPGHRSSTSPNPKPGPCSPRTPGGTAQVTPEPDAADPALRHRRPRQRDHRPDPAGPGPDPPPGT